MTVCNICLVNQLVATVDVYDIMLLENVLHAI